ncbi:hypothetical protein ABTH15_19490, partial [Acinetobacter baumannii]
SATASLPERWQTETAARLVQGESVLAWLELDLDAQLQFNASLVLATDRRLLALAPDRQQWQEWAYRPDLQLKHVDHAGVGTLELCDAAS